MWALSLQLNVHPRLSRLGVKRGSLSVLNRVAPSVMPIVDTTRIDKESHPQSSTIVSLSLTTQNKAAASHVPVAG